MFCIYYCSASLLIYTWAVRLKIYKTFCSRNYIIEVGLAGFSFVLFFKFKHFWLLTLVLGNMHKSAEADSKLLAIAVPPYNVYWKLKFAHKIVFLAVNCTFKFVSVIYLVIPHHFLFGIERLSLIG